MNGGDEPVRLPLEADIDTSGIQRAQQEVERFEGSLEDLMRRLDALRQAAVTAFNALGISHFGGSMPGSYEVGATGQRVTQDPYRQLMQFLGRNPAIAGASPELTQALHEVMRLEHALAEGRYTGTTPEPEEEGTRTGRPRQRSQMYGPQTFTERFASTVMSSRGLGMLGAFAMGDLERGGRTLARAFMDALVSVPSVRALRLFGGPGAAGAATAGTEEGAAAGAETGAGAAAGAGGASIVARLGEFLLSPAGLIGAGVAAAGAVALGVETLRAQARGQQLQLQTNVGGLGYAPLNAAMGDVYRAVQPYQYSPQEARTLANQLGRAGVGAGQITNAAGDIAGFARGRGLDLNQVTQLGTTLLVQGRMTTEQMAHTFDTLAQGADNSGQSLGRLVDGLVDFQRASGGTALTALGASGLVAIQQRLGPAVSAGGVMGPSFQLMGMQQTGAAALLGIPTARLAGIEQRGDTAQMFDVMANFARRTAGGRTDQDTVNAIESMLEGAGLLQRAGVSPANMTAIVRTMITQPPGAAEAQAQRFRQQQQQQGERQFQDQMRRIADAITPPFTKAANAAQYAAAQLSLIGNDLNAARVRMGGQQPAAYPADSALSPLWRLAGPQGFDVGNTRGQTLHMGPALNEIIGRAADQTGTPAELIAAIAARETDLQSWRINPKSGARGLGQFLPSTLDSLRKQQKSPIYGMTHDQAMAAALDPTIGAQLIGFYMHQLYQQQGSYQAALTAYNGGDPGGARATILAAQRLGARYAAAPNAQAAYQPAPGPAESVRSTPTPTPGAGSGPGGAVTATPTPGTVDAHGATSGQRVVLSGTLEVRQGGQRIGTAQVAPKSVTIDTGRTPVGGHGHHGPPVTRTPVPERSK